MVSPAESSQFHWQMKVFSCPFGSSAGSGGSVVVTVSTVFSCVATLISVIVALLGE